VTSDLERLIARLDRLIDRVEAIVPLPPPPVAWDKAIAFRWKRRGGHGHLLPVAHPHVIRLEELRDIDRQKEAVEQNTRQFVAGQSANNVLLTGARGTGKSSLVKALLNRYHEEGLRLIEVDKQDLVDLQDITDLVARRPERFIIFCDDLSFEASESAYKALKVALDGSIAAASENALIYATSNRRHLMPEYMQENLEYRTVGDEIHPGETSEEKVSLSERFGLWVSFWPFDQDEYLDIVAHWLHRFGVPAQAIEGARTEALQWALGRGSRSGRVAWQFARDYAGRQAARAVAPSGTSKASKRK
jgi:predicted AAA+ superfamily ATPase